MIVVSLTLASICFMGECFPILYGENTHPGLYNLVIREIGSSIYKDVLQFDENDDMVFAIHSLISVNGQNRKKRLLSLDINDNKITNGCINVSEEVYNKLKYCCSNSQLIIKF